MPAMSSAHHRSNDGRESSSWPLSHEHPLLDSCQGRDQARIDASRASAKPWSDPVCGTVRQDSEPLPSGWPWIGIVTWRRIG